MAKYIDNLWLVIPPVVFVKTWTISENGRRCHKIGNAFLCYSHIEDFRIIHTEYVDKTHVNICAKSFTTKHNLFTNIPIESQDEKYKEIERDLQKVYNKTSFFPSFSYLFN